MCSNCADRLPSAVTAAFGGDGERLRILRPATGVRQMSFKDLKKNYTPISADDAKASWVAEYEAGDCVEINQ